MYEIVSNFAPNARGSPAFYFLSSGIVTGCIYVKHVLAVALIHNLALAKSGHQKYHVVVGLSDFPCLAS